MTPNHIPGASNLDDTGQQRELVKQMFIFVYQSSPYVFYHWPFFFFLLQIKFV